MYKRIAQSVAGDFEYLYDKAKDYSDLRSEALKIIEKIDDLERSLRY